MPGLSSTDPLLLPPPSPSLLAPASRGRAGLSRSPAPSLPLLRRPPEAGFVPRRPSSLTSKSSPSFSSAPSRGTSPRSVVISSPASSWRSDTWAAAPTVASGTAASTSSTTNAKRSIGHMSQPAGGGGGGGGSGSGNGGNGGFVGHEQASRGSQPPLRSSADEYATSGPHSYPSSAFPGGGMGQYGGSPPIPPYPSYSGSTSAGASSSSYQRRQYMPRPPPQGPPSQLLQPPPPQHPHHAAYATDVPTSSSSAMFHNDASPSSLAHPAPSSSSSTWGYVQQGSPVTPGPSSAYMASPGGHPHHFGDASASTMGPYAGGPNDGYYSSSSSVGGVGGGGGGYANHPSSGSAGPGATTLTPGAGLGWQVSSTSPSGASTSASTFGAPNPDAGEHQMAAGGAAHSHRYGATDPTSFDDEGFDDDGDDDGGGRGGDGSREGTTAYSAAATYTSRPFVVGYGPSQSSDSPQQLLGSFQVKHRRRTTRGQFRVLEGTFQATPKPSAAIRKQLSEQLDMPPRAVQIWFQNRRAKAKTMAKKEAAKREADATAAARLGATADAGLGYATGGGGGLASSSSSIAMMAGSSGSGSSQVASTSRPPFMGRSSMSGGASAPSSYYGGGAGSSGDGSVAAGGGGGVGGRFSPESSRGGSVSAGAATGFTLPSSTAWSRRPGHSSAPSSATASHDPGRTYSNDPSASSSWGGPEGSPSFAGAPVQQHHHHHHQQQPGMHSPYAASSMPAANSLGLPPSSADFGGYPQYSATSPPAPTSMPGGYYHHPHAPATWSPSMTHPSSSARGAGGGGGGPPAPHQGPHAMHHAQPPPPPSQHAYHYQPSPQHAYPYAPPPPSTVLPPPPGTTATTTGTTMVRSYNAATTTSSSPSAASSSTAHASAWPPLPAGGVEAGGDAGVAAAGGGHQQHQHQQQGGAGAGAYGGQYAASVATSTGGGAFGTGRGGGGGGGGGGHVGPAGASVGGASGAGGGGMGGVAWTYPSGHGRPGNPAYASSGGPGGGGGGGGGSSDVGGAGAGPQAASRGGAGHRGYDSSYGGGMAGRYSFPG